MNIYLLSPFLHILERHQCLSNLVKLEGVLIRCRVLTIVGNSWKFDHPMDSPRILRLLKRFLELVLCLFLFSFCMKCFYYVVEYSIYTLSGLMSPLLRCHHHEPAYTRWEYFLTGFDFLVITLLLDLIN